MRLIDFSLFHDHKHAHVVNFSSDFDIVLLGVGCLSQGEGGTYDRKEREKIYRKKNNVRKCPSLQVPGFVIPNRRNRTHTYLYIFPQQGGSHIQ